MADRGPLGYVWERIKQASVSKMERRTDMYIGTLAKFIEAMGGQLEIRAVFPDGSVRITVQSGAVTVVLGSVTWPTSPGFPRRPWPGPV